MTRLGLTGILIALLALGCANGAGKNVAESCRDIILLEGELELPFLVEEWVRDHHRTQGVHVLPRGEYAHVLVAMGERPTGGYRVELLDAFSAGDHVLLEVAYHQPRPGDMVSQALTYPYLLTSVKTCQEVRVQLREDRRVTPLPVPANPGGRPPGNK